MNIVLITLDAVRSDRLGCYGYSKSLTPNIDRLARDGICFTNAYCQAPITLVSHASFLTGLLPFNHRVRNNGLYVLDRGILTLASILREHGYATAAFVGGFPVHSRFGLNDGFDYYDDNFFESNLEEKLYELGILKGQEKWDFRQFGPGKFARRSSAVTKSAISWLNTNRADNFFLWMHYFDAHSPCSPPLIYRTRGIFRWLWKSLKNRHYRLSGLRQRLWQQLYEEEIAFIDEWFGRFLNYLRNEGIFDNTLFIVAADHGESFGEHGLSGHGMMLYEEIIKIPLILCCANTLPRNRTVNSLVSSVDVVPTVLEVLNIPYVSQRKFDGTSLIPRLEKAQENGGQREIYCETFYPRENWNKPAYAALIRQRWKLVMEVDGPQILLFDMRSDATEDVNVAAEHPDIVAEMSAKLKEIRSEDDYHSRQISDADEAVKRRLRALGYLE